jgi:hypothetical protein
MKEYAEHLPFNIWLPENATDLLPVVLRYVMRNPHSCGDRLHRIGFTMVAMDKSMELKTSAAL